jgi:uncharacterized membrane protein YhiD involved in acid resistance
MIGISTIQFALRLWLAIGMGAIVGLERQWRQRMAGTRTKALVAVGAAAFVMCSPLLDNEPSARADGSSPTRACVRGSLHQHGPPTTGLSTSPRPSRSYSCRNAL